MNNEDKNSIMVFLKEHADLAPIETAYLSDYLNVLVAQEKERMRTILRKHTSENRVDIPALWEDFELL